MGGQWGDNERLCVIGGVYGWNDIFLQRVSNTDPPDQQANALPAELLGLPLKSI